MDYDLVIGDCLTRAEAIRNHAGKLAQEEFPSSEPRQLAVTIGKLAVALGHHLVSFRMSSDYDAQKGGGHIRLVNGLIIFFSEYLRYTDGAVSRKVPWSMVTALQEFSRKMVPGVVVMLRPKWHYNYSIMMDDFRQWLISSVQGIPQKNLGADVFDELPKGDFHIVSFPFVERKSILLHAALAHEIGHLVIEKFLISDPDIIPHDLHDRIVNSVEKDVKSESIAPLYKVDEISARSNEVGEYRKRAIAEIGSDLIAVRMIGPAALFASYAMCLGQKVDERPSVRNNRYPSWRTRLRYSLSELESMGFCDMNCLQTETPSESLQSLKAFQKLIDAVGTFVQDKADVAAIQSDRLVAIAYEWLDRSKARLIEFVRKECENKTGVGPTAQFWRTVCGLADRRLRQDLPPNTTDDDPESTQPASFEAILNAAWLYRLTELHVPQMDKQNIAEFVHRYDRINRLTLRAIELASLHRAYLGHC